MIEEYLLPLILGAVFFVVAMVSAFLVNRHEDQQERRRKHQKIRRRK